MSAIGTKRTCARALQMSAIGGKADIGAGVSLPALTHEIPTLCVARATAIVGNSG